MQDQHVDILQRKRNFLAAEAIIPLIHYSTVAYAHNKALTIVVKAHIAWISNELAVTIV